MSKWIQDDMTLANIFVTFFTYDLQEIFQRTHVRKDINKEVYNSQMYMWRKVKEMVRNMLRFCDNGPACKPTDITLIPDWIKHIKDMPKEITTLAKDLFENEMSIKASRKSKTEMPVCVFNKNVALALKSEVLSSKLQLPNGSPTCLY